MKINNPTRKFILSFVTLGSLVMILLLDPISQDQSYHIFADQRSFLSIPNFFDVITNILFAFIGLIGLYFTSQIKSEQASVSWFVLFFGIFTLCFSSGYYHWNPTDKTLFWDRLSLTLIFTSMVIALLSEYISLHLEKLLLWPAIVIGIFSTVYWILFQDLRIYFWVQLTPIIMILLLLILFPGKKGEKKYLIMTLSFYLLAKIVEIYDKEIFIMNNEILSGHSLKHIFAAAGVLSLLLMIKKRK